jgi:ribosomal-protein-alanine N-acetyltransferase
MQIFKSILPRVALPKSPRLDLVLQGERIFLRGADVTDWRAWCVAREGSRDFLTPWEPLWPPNALTYNYYCNLVRRQAMEWRKGTGFTFLIYLRETNDREAPLVGGIALTEIQRGAVQKAMLGYWIAKTHAGQGLMTEAATLVCDFAFHALRLHRIEAVCMPWNEPSKGLLTKLGFEVEGYAKNYMKINGAWEDHLLWAKKAGDKNVGKSA